MSKQLKVSKLAKCYSVALLLISFICALSFNAQVQAQTQYKIQTNSNDLSSEYKKELDKWLLLAYEGDPEAQFRTGVLYTNEQQGDPDFEQAVYWYKQASRQGHVLAQYNLGHHFLTGSGVEKNETSAIQWWTEAAENEHALAQFNIGRAYYLGIGTPEDHVKSRYWFERAALNNEEKSIEILQQLGWNDGENSALAAASSVEKNNVPPLVSRIKSAEIYDDSEISADNKITANRELDAVSESTAISGVEAIREPTAISSVEAISDVEAVSESKAVSPVVVKTDSQASVISEPKVVSNITTLNSELRDSTRWKTNSTINNSRVITNTSDGFVKTAPPTITKTDDIKDSSSQEISPATKTTPVVLYTNPAIRSVLITIVDDRDSLEVISTAGDWMIVKNQAGMPVWIHQDYLRVSGDTATVTGDSVNARSVPIVSNGTKVGSLDRGDKVTVVDQKNNWFRVVSPPDFKAWVKTEDYYKRSGIISNPT